MDRAKLHAWLTAQIEERRPPAELAAGFGQPIQELARTLAALEQGGGMVFGMSVQGDDLAPFARAARTALVEWRTRLADVHGDEGHDMVTSMAARCEIVLDDAPLEPIAPSAAVEHFVASLVPAQLECAWRAANDLDDDQALRIQVGEPDAARLAHVVQIAREAFGCVLPASYRALLEIYNGVALYAFDPPASLVRVAGHELSEPVIWPADAYGDHLLFADTFDGMRAFVFGELADAGFLVLDATGDAPVYWVPQRFSDSKPTQLAASFDAFLVTFAECAANVALLLRRAGVPGWGE